MMTDKMSNEGCCVSVIFFKYKKPKIASTTLIKEPSIKQVAAVKNSVRNENLSIK